MFDRYINVNNRYPLSLDAIRALAPSAFATMAHSSRSRSYTYIPTSDVIDGMIKAGFQPFAARQSTTRTVGKVDYTKHMIRFRRTDADTALVSDSVPEVILINSHDGSSAYKLIADVYRKVCMNGLAVSEGTISSFAVAHKGNIVERVIEGSFEILRSTNAVLGTVRDWQRLSLTEGEQHAYAQAAHVLRFGDEDGKTTTPIQPVQLLRSRRTDDNANTLWHTFNRVQENVVRGGLRGVQAATEGRRARRVTTREVTGIDQNVKLNRALWTLTEELAKLKGAA